MYRKLPNGCWINFGNMTAEATDEQFQEFLALRGIDVPIENISVSRGQNFQQMAVVSIPHEGRDSATMTLNRVVNAIAGDLFMGRELRISCPAASSERNKGPRRERNPRTKVYQQGFEE
jgi:hypothetical protein